MVIPHAVATFLFGALLLKTIKGVVHQEFGLHFGNLGRSLLSPNYNLALTLFILGIFPTKITS